MSLSVGNYNWLPLGVELVEGLRNQKKEIRKVRLLPKALVIYMAVGSHKQLWQRWDTGGVRSTVLIAELCLREAHVCLINYDSFRT